MNKKVLVKFPSGEYKEIDPELLVEVPFDILPDVINDVAPSKTRATNASQEQFNYTLQDQETIYIDPETYVDTRKVPEMDYNIYVPLLITDFNHTKPRRAFHSRGSKTDAHSTEWEHYYDREETLPRDVQIAINKGEPHQRLSVSIDGRKSPYVQCYDEETNTIVTRVLFPGIINFHISFHPSFNEELIDSVNGSKRISVIEETEDVYDTLSEQEYCFGRGMLEKMPVITKSKTFGYDESNYGRKK